MVLTLVTTVNCRRLLIPMNWCSRRGGWKGECGQGLLSEYGGAGVRKIIRLDYGIGQPNSTISVLILMKVE